MTSAGLARQRHENRGWDVPMSKSELVKRILSQNPHLRLGDVERILDVIVDGIVMALADEKRVELRGFGVFSVKRRPSRMGRNPKTGVEVKVASKKVPFFKSGKEVRQILNRD